MKFLLELLPNTPPPPLFMCLMCSRSRTRSPTVPPCNIWRSHSLIIIPEQCSVVLFVSIFFVLFFAPSISFHATVIPALSFIICRPDILGNCRGSRISVLVSKISFYFMFSVVLSLLSEGVKVKNQLRLRCNEEGDRHLCFFFLLPFSHLYADRRGQKTDLCCI